VKIEIPVDGYDKEPWNGISDYAGSSRKCNGCMIEPLEGCFETQGFAWTESQSGHGVFDLFILEVLKV
jgi:hypothetical protein